MTERPPLLVTDTNIWIDLENGGLLVEVFQLLYQFVIPDFALSELSRPRWETLEEMGVSVHDLSTEQVLQLIELRQVYRNLSVIDLAAFVLAKGLDAALLTGDRRLNALANAHGLTVHGVLWLLDALVESEIVPPFHAAEALNRMVEVGARLPPDECEKRKTAWSP